MISPNTYLSNSHLDDLKVDLSKLFFGSKEKKESFFLTENGRSALYLLLKSLNFDEGSRIAVQPFTCNSAINPVLWNDLEPVYIDINIENLSMDPNLLDAALSSSNHNIKAVLLQHTFGIPGSIHEIKEICETHGLILIEDCAHSIGGAYNGKKLGTYGDSAIISFGLEKNLPTKVGGALLVNNVSLIDTVQSNYKELNPVGWFRTFLWLINPLIRILSRKMGDLGKSIVDQLEKLGLFEVGFSEVELSGGMPSRYPKRMSKPIARVAGESLQELNTILKKRSDDSSYYLKQINDAGLTKNLNTNILNDVSYLKFPFFASNYNEREALQSHLIASNFYLSDWYENPIYPAGTDQKELQYTDGSCPVAEKACNTVINLPTGDPFSPKIVSTISQFYGSTDSK